MKAAAAKLRSQYGVDSTPMGLVEGCDSGHPLASPNTERNARDPLVVLVEGVIR